MVSIFLYEQQQFHLANKMHQIAATLFNVFCVPTPLSDCIPTVVSCIQENLAASPSSPSELSNDKDSITSMVLNMLTLVSLFLPQGPKFLLSSHGINVLFKILSSVCPPTPSPYVFTFSLPSTSEVTDPQLDIPVHTPSTSSTSPLPSNFLVNEEISPSSDFLSSEELSTLQQLISASSSFSDPSTTFPYSQIPPSPDNSSNSSLTSSPLPSPRTPATNLPSSPSPLPSPSSHLQTIPYFLTQTQSSENSYNVQTREKNSQRKFGGNEIFEKLPEDDILKFLMPEESSFNDN